MPELKLVRVKGWMRVFKNDHWEEKPCPFDRNVPATDPEDAKIRLLAVFGQDEDSMQPARLDEWRAWIETLPGFPGYEIIVRKVNGHPLPPTSTG